MGKARAASVAAALALALSSVASANDRACPSALAVVGYPDGTELTRVALAPGGTFSLSFLHSVTRRTVIDRYVVEGDRIVQTAEEFDDHGPGLPSSAEAGVTWERRDGVFIVSMRRDISRLIVRGHVDYANTLHGAAILDLTQWGRRAVEIVAAGCDPKKK